MADNVNITAGAGTTIATDQCGTDHFQKIKLADGTADSTTMVVAGGGVEAAALRVTIASDSTGVVSVDDNGGALTVDGTVTANLSATDNAVLDTINTAVESIDTAVELLDNAVDGNYLNTNMNIAGTDVVGGAGAVAAGVQRITLASDDPGVAYLATIAGDTTSLDGKVTACDTGAVVLAAGTAEVGKLAAGTALIGKVGIDQVTANANEVVVKSGTVTAVTAITNALPAGTALLGKVGIDQVTANANEVVVKSGTVTAVTSITNAVAVTNAGITSIDGKVTACDTGAVVVASGAITETNSASLAVVGGGAEATALRVTLANDSTGVITVDGAVTSTATCAGDVASDSGDSGNPVKVGGKSVNMDGTTPGTAVAEADRTNLITDLYGRLLVDTSHPCFWSVAANYTEAQTATEVKATPGASLSLYITDIVISNGATAGNIRLLEDTAAAADKTGKMYFAINGGAALHFRTPIKLTANKNLGITSVTCTTHSVTVSGYTAP